MPGEGLPFRHEELAARLQDLERQVLELQRELYTSRAEMAGAWSDVGHTNYFDLSSAAGASAWFNAGVTGFGYQGGNVLVTTAVYWTPSITTHGNYEMRVTDGISVSDSFVRATNAVGGGTLTVQNCHLEWQHPWRTVPEDRSHRLGAEKLVPSGQLLKFQLRRLSGNFQLLVWTPRRLIWSNSEMRPAATTGGLWTHASGEPL